MTHISIFSKQFNTLTKLKFLKSRPDFVGKLGLVVEDELALSMDLDRLGTEDELPPNPRSFISAEGEEDTDDEQSIQSGVKASDRGQY